MRDTAVIILNYKSLSMTETCADQLLRLGVDADLVIVDNHSMDGSFEELKKRYKAEPNILVIETTGNGGYSYGNNCGIRAAEKLRPHRFISVMNPDVFLESNIFPMLLQKLGEDPRCAAISGKMLLPGGTKDPKSEIVAWRIPTPKGVYMDALKRRQPWDRRKTYRRLDDRYVRTELLPGSFFIIKKNVFEKIGWFDEGEFLYNEENILGIRLKKLHLYCLIDTAVSYEHRHVFGYGHTPLYNYQHNMDRILEMNRKEYRSRDYLCRTYYGGKYRERLRMVYKINTALIYSKYLLGRFIGIFCRPEK